MTTWRFEGGPWNGRQLEVPDNLTAPQKQIVNALHEPACTYQLARKVPPGLFVYEPIIKQMTLHFQLYDGDVTPNTYTTPKIEVLQVLDVEFDGRWHVFGSDVDAPGRDRIEWNGWADNKIDAILDWLADRMGVERERE
jgi:hypothetical protein